MGIRDKLNQVGGEYIGRMGDDILRYKFAESEEQKAPTMTIVLSMVCFSVRNH